MARGEGTYAYYMKGKEKRGSGGTDAQALSPSPEKPSQKGRLFSNNQPCGKKSPHGGQQPLREAPPTDLALEENTHKRPL